MQYRDDLRLVEYNVNDVCVKVDEVFFLAEYLGLCCYKIGDEPWTYLINKQDIQWLVDKVEQDTRSASKVKHLLKRDYKDRSMWYVTYVPVTKGG